MGNFARSAAVATAVLAVTAAALPVPSAAADGTASFAPAITSVSPSPFSPNADGDKDTTKVSYTLDAPQRVTWSVTDSAGAVVVRAHDLGDQRAGAHSLTFFGKGDSGTQLPDGTYRFNLDTTGQLNGVEASGHAQAAVTIDVTGPNPSNVKVDFRTFYPYRDGYRDKVTVSFSFNEHLSLAGVDIRNSSNKSIAGEGREDLAPGRASFVWNGMNTNTKVRAPAGTYLVRLVLLDDADNATVSSPYKIVLSDKKLVKLTGTKTVSAQGSAVAVHAGACSRVVKPGAHKWSGSIGYLSDWDGCGIYDGASDYASVIHSTFLPRAVKYGSVRVDPYGGASLPNHQLWLAVLIYLLPDVTPTNTTRMLKPAVKRYTGPTVGARFVSKGGRFVWSVGTVFGAWYDVKDFKLHYTYYVLR